MFVEVCVSIVTFACEWVSCLYFFCCFFFQAEDGIRDLVRSRGLGDVYKRQAEEMGVRYLGAIPLAPEVVTLSDRGKPVVGEDAPLSLIHI